MATDQHRPIATTTGKDKNTVVGNTLPAKLANATLLGNYPSSSPEWHEMRATRIGGSEVGAIAGESKYESAYSLWAKKTGKIPSQQTENEFMYWGKALEPVVIDRFERDHPELTVYRDAGTWVNNEYDFMLANPDAILLDQMGQHGILEIKTARYDDDWRDGVPKYYQTQVQWYLRTFGFDYAYLACLFAGSNYQEFTIMADPMWQEHDLEKVQEFLMCVISDIRPNWDGSEATLQTVRELNPDISYDATVELGALGADYLDAVSDLTEHKSKVNRLSSEIIDQMNTARIGNVGGEAKIIRQSRTGSKPYLTKKRGAK
tara:strand:+ start:1080 stop:2033 length:954 start_codon:yes stop_codon:yes gene_type:complete